MMGLITIIEIIITIKTLITIIPAVLLSLPGAAYIRSAGKRNPSFVRPTLPQDDESNEEKP
jgi:hypothetical protein